MNIGHRTQTRTNRCIIFSSENELREQHTQQLDYNEQQQRRIVTLTRKVE
jgi:hypothetical protein